ncbi:histone-binding protein RBBP4 [Chlamydoabsidia padenii]|nr:histone-binding protein RBBP4 [Chlamydoabsidia padenii]
MLLVGACGHSFKSYWSIFASVRHLKYWFNPADRTSPFSPPLHPSRLKYAMADSPSGDIKDEQQQINEEYQLWKKTTPLLYDLVVTQNLTWPTLTCQWMPQLSKQGLLIGTNTNDEETNYTQLLSVDIPQTEHIPATVINSALKARIYLTQKIEHPGEVNRVRYQPFNPNIIATKTRDGPVLVFDLSSPLSTSAPLLKLTGHSKEGYGLTWNPHKGKSNHILSAGFDHLICHWDIGMIPEGEDKALTPYQRYEGHTDCVEDVSWNATNDSVFASVADDMNLMIWDTRTGTSPTQRVQAHKAEINTVAFHPHQEWMIATGSSDKTIGLFDIRKLGTKLHSFDMHDGDIHQVAWSPHDEPIIASAATDRKIMIWDLRRIGEEQTPEDAEDGPPELMFVHNGHTSRISEFDWNPLEPWMIASAAEDNIIQVWQVEYLYKQR